MISSQTCNQLHLYLKELKSLYASLQFLKDHLLTEGPSSFDEVQGEFFRKKAEIKKVQAEIEHLLLHLQQEQEDTPESIKKKLQDIGTPATLDESFEGGIIRLTIPDDLKTKLGNWDSIEKTYEDADTTGAYINNNLSRIPLTAPIPSSLDVMVLNHGQTTEAQRDKLVEDMDKAGYRPLHFQELVALGVIRPDLNKRSEVLNTYEKHTLGGHVRSLFLCWGGVKRRLNADFVSSGWGVRVRFLFVRE